MGLGLALLLAVRHPFRKPLRFLLVIHVGGCLVLAAVVSAQAFRYGYQLIPLFILVASAAFVACARALAHSVRPAAAPAGWQVYAGGVGLALILATLGLGSGLTAQFPTLTRFRAEGGGITVYKWPDRGGATRYLKEHNPAPAHGPGPPVGPYRGGDSGGLRPAGGT